MLELSSFDLDEIASALTDQTDYEHRWLINPETGEVAYWTSDTGIDGQTPVDIDELDLICIDPLPPHAWYQDMADFAGQLSDEHAGRRLERAIRGKGAFRRFKDELHEEYPQLLPAWYAFRDACARRRAVEWLTGNSLVGHDAAARFLYEHPSLMCRDPNSPFAAIFTEFARAHRAGVDADPGELGLDLLLPAGQAVHGHRILIGRGTIRRRRGCSCRQRGRSLAARAAAVR